MRKTILGIFLLLPLSLGAAELPVAQPFSLPDLDDVTHDLSEYRGRFLLLEFFITRCPDCTAMVPRLQRLREAIPERFLAMVAINNREPVERLRTYAQQHSITYQILRDPTTEVFWRYNIEHVPTLFLIDPLGRILGTWDYGSEAEEAMEAILLGNMY